ncbi:MAG: hypothetical protein EU539_05020 [Promethearchaeota archaeon]|nr:MAG: hypothetical protein EU539_05020 [Candidatus Lokiarchaeota archaeon]
MELTNEIPIKNKYQIPLKTQKFILQMCMAQWDSQWYLKSKKRFGVKETNKLNQNVVFSIGKIEVRHILSALGIKKGDIRTVSEMFKIMNTIMDILIPKFMKFNFVAKSENEGLARVDKCFIWKEVQKSKEAMDYVCACNFRHRGWLEAMSLNGKIIPLKRFSKGDDCCEFKFILEENLGDNST